MKIKREVYEKILNSYPLVPPENGGIIGCKDGIICKYFHDNSSNITDKAVYCPDVDTLNDIIDKWGECGVEFAGIVHSHRTDESSLSINDKEYIRSLFKVLPESMSKIYFPIVLPESKQFVSHLVIKGFDDILYVEDVVRIVDKIKSDYLQKR